MNATLQPPQPSLEEGQPLRDRTLHPSAGLYARRSALFGTAAWAGLALLARADMVHIGAIELLFLFAPLVIVPLGLELARRVRGSPLSPQIAFRLPPLAAASAVIAICLPPGKAAASVAIGWLFFCSLLGWNGLRALLRAARTRTSDLSHIILAIAELDLVVGGAWLVASRLNIRPMGIQEPIGLLTAVHFHYAGFATATISAATLSLSRNRSRNSLKIVAPLVAILPFLVAAGFVISPALRMAAAVAFSAAVAALAIILRICAKQATDATARVLLQIASAAVFAGMILAAAYAITNFLTSDALTIPQMARTHGLLNAFGFCLPALLGWLIEFNEP